MSETTVKVLKPACPTCGCECYDDEPETENPLKQFARRLAWAGKVWGVGLSARFESREGRPRLVAIDVKPPEDGR